MSCVESRAKSLTIECLQMRNDSSIINILGEHIEDLSLLKCSHLSYDILRAIGERCPNLRKIPCFNLRSLSLVVDVISDNLLITVMHSLPRLELDLEDRPFMEPSVRDMTNIGLPALKFCECLIVLSIVRSERNYPSFKRVKNIGMFHVSERCRRLESVKLGGFAKVTEAGYSSILHSCRNLKKFEVLTSPLLSD
ncbi:F-box protein At-B [Capsicum baccatum]|uniref:F-box protein At-B n=1 Tax=Capsicum baccatum TaxID=33114 RepID=A0A2G2V1Z2_CAPBA|nr:F-box protein At-B [Capsicum baccatum]